MKTARRDEVAEGDYSDDELLRSISISSSSSSSWHHWTDASIRL